MSTSETCYLNTPRGWLKVSADEAGLTEISFIDEPPKTPQPVHLPHLKEAYRQLTEYFRGERISVNLAGYALRAEVRSKLSSFEDAAPA